MNDHDGLLVAILSSPDDDTPRLIFADWLEEHAGTLACGACDGTGCPFCGGPERDYHTGCGRCPACRGSGRVPDSRAARAEFVRVQCELARLVTARHGVEYAHDPDRVDTLRRRERALWDAHGRGCFLVPPVSWVNSPDGGADYVGGSGPAVSATVRRGFVESVTLAAADWLAHEAALYWRPGLSDPCPKIKWRVLAGTVDVGTRRRAKKDGRPNPCPAWCEGGCGGKGTVPRPMPPTACPITRVTLTTWPEHAYRYRGDNRLVLREAERPGDWEVRVREALAARWPGVTFHLPPVRGFPTGPAAG